MGIKELIFGTPRKEKKPKEPPKKFTYESWMEAQAKKVLKDLAKTDPETVKQMIIADLAARKHLEFDKLPKKPDPLSDYKRMRKEIKEMKEEDNGNSWIRDALAGAAQIFIENQRAQNATKVTVSDPNAPPQIQSNGAPAALTAGTQPQQGQDMGFIEQQKIYWVIGQLDGKTPEQAVKWLLKRKEPEAVALVQRIKMTPEQKLPELLSEMETKSAALQPLVAFFRQRAGWTLDVTRLLQGQAVSGKSAGL